MPLDTGDGDAGPTDVRWPRNSDDQRSEAHIGAAGMVSIAFKPTVFELFELFEKGRLPVGE